MPERLGQFADLVRLPHEALDLGLGALLIAQIEHPGLSPAHSLMHLGELAGASGAAHIGDPLKALHRLREFLFEEEGFTGNVDDYYDPRNSCLNDVLERRRGIPITLSVIMMEVGRRLGLKIVGVGLPGISSSAPRWGRSPSCWTRSTAGRSSPTSGRPTWWRETSRRKRSESPCSVKKSKTRAARYWLVGS